MYHNNLLTKYKYITVGWYLIENQSYDDLLSKNQKRDLLVRVSQVFVLQVAIFTSSHCFTEGLPGVLGNKGTKGKCRREQGNMTPVLGHVAT